ncbi:TraR/DksA C4-type zinc finger protein [Salipaludibacillus daqingensis]|uniref:TraR/DksA C4-type zinc finger protein n=1 Tax=Salipaludibacillus daqingensis TaxID=3041001 RepID=UPI002474BD04|nr:TraR/DksA C4-type zinc finger protein [Salipaludibacillus daqingensis]
MKQTEREFFKKELMKMKEDYEGSLSESSYNQATYSKGEELSYTSNHPGDLGTEMFEQQKDKALDQHTNDKLEEVNEALTAIEDGNYGYCSVCNKKIPIERMEIVPTAKYCIDHAHAIEQESKRERPVEEEVIQPLDHDGTSFKEELRQDTWNTVSEHGTSDSEVDSFDEDKE